MKIEVSEFANFVLQFCQFEKGMKIKGAEIWSFWPRDENQRDENERKTKLTRLQYPPIGEEFKSSWWWWILLRRMDVRDNRGGEEETSSPPSREDVTAMSNFFFLLCCECWNEKIHTKVLCMEHENMYTANEGIAQ